MPKNKKNKGVGKMETGVVVDVDAQPPHAVSSTGTLRRDQTNRIIRFLGGDPGLAATDPVKFDLETIGGVLIANHVSPK